MTLRPTAKGVYRIECDIRKTKDGVLVLMHDATVDRTTDGTGELRGMTYAELQKLNAVGGAGGGTGSEPVPTLEEVLAVAKTAGVRLGLYPIVTLRNSYRISTARKQNRPSTQKVGARIATEPKHKRTIFA